MQFLHNHQINKAKWDECVANAANSLIYARSFYLDEMSPQWSALVAEDYQWILPITWRQKWTIKYLYQPAFTQQLGAFYRTGANIPWNEIILFLKKQYGFWEVSFNYSTPQNILPSAINVNQGTNFRLPLDASYENVRSNYHNDLIKNLKRSQKFRSVYRPAKNYLRCIDEYIKHYAERTKHVTATDYDNFKKVCDAASNNNMLVCREVVNQQNELLSTVLLLKDGNRLYNMMNTTTSAGRKVEANHLLMDSIISEFAGQRLIFDFEGSDLPGVKSFYENFGAINQPYFMVKYNGLPWPLRLFK